MKLTFSNIKSWLAANQWTGDAAAFLVAAFFYWPLQNNGVFPDADSFYHLKMAELIMARGPVRDFVWMPFTTLGKHFADQHFLYHVALIPLIKVFGALGGMKVATTVFAAGTIGVVSLVLRRLGIKAAPVFALLLAVMAPFVFRINLAKASAPGVVLLTLGMYFAVKRKVWPLFTVAFLYVWTHGSWPALLGLGSVAIVVASWKKEWPASLRELRMPLAALWLGALAGVIVNPFFPHNLQFYWEQIFQIAVVNYKSKIIVGAEWSAYDPVNLVTELPALFALMAIAIVVSPFAKGADRRAALSFSIGALAFLLLTLRSRRHVEYFAPLALIASALWIEPFARPDIKKIFDKNRLTAFALAFGVLVMGALFAGRQLRGARDDLSKGFAFDLYNGETDWLKANVPAGEVIVHANGLDFPPLFLRDDIHRYIMGLDPTFLYRADPALYQQYMTFTQGHSFDPVGVMKHLGSKFVLIGPEYGALRYMLDASNKFKEVYEDKDGYIYQLAE